MKGQAGIASKGREQEEEAAGLRSLGREPQGGRTTPTCHVWTAVASMRTSHAFGPMVAAESQREGLSYQAKRKAFLADGAAYQRVIHKALLPGLRAITDRLHVLVLTYSWTA